LRIEDLSKKTEQLVTINKSDLITLPYPYDSPEKDPTMRELSPEQRERYDASLDGVVAVGIPRLKSKEDEEAFIQKFLSGLAKLFEKENNWTFLQPLYHSLEYCVKCQICNDSCPAYVASGRKEIYRPTFRPEVLRRIIDKYIKKKNKAILKLTGSDIELNWTLIARLAELAYRCTLCRKCAQVCPLGIDNALISHEIRKLFSQEMGIAPKELHEQGTVQQLNVGSSTGVSPKALANIIEFMEDDIEEKIGRRIKIPVDKKGAEILLLHNAGEFMSWPENTEAFAIIFDAAGIDWTLSSETVGYDAVNYGVWYDDIQLARGRPKSQKTSE
jgi:ferredoxin